MFPLTWAFNIGNYERVGSGVGVEKTYRILGTIFKKN